jgi:sugar diacid utilization regulator
MRELEERARPSLLPMLDGFSVPLPYVMAAFRVGFSRIWERLVDRARGQDLVPSDVLVDAASDIWAAHDTFAEAMASAYRDTAMAQVLRDERERSALVAALLEARVLEDTTVWEIADLLGLPRQGPFVVVAAESTQIAQEALPHVDAQLRIRGIGSAWRLLPELHVGIIRLPDAGHLGQLTTVLTGTARARVGVSPAYTQLTDTAAALRFARVAMATTPPGTPAVTLFDDHPLAVAAVSAPDTMQHTAQTVLGAVLDLPPEQSSLLLQTLAAWRDNAGSATATARQMFCHPNTIRQRLRKLESCTGRSLSDPRATAELFLALEAILLLPPS